MFKCMKWLLLWRTSFSTGLAHLIKASVVCFLDLDKCFCSVVGPCSLQLSLVGKAHLKCNHISTFYLSSYHCNIGLMLFVVVFSILAQLNGHFSSVFFLVLKKTRIRQVYSSVAPLSINLLFTEIGLIRSGLLRGCSWTQVNCWNVTHPRAQESHRDGRLPSGCSLFAAHWDCITLLLFLIERDKTIFPPFVRIALAVSFQA